MKSEYYLFGPLLLIVIFIVSRKLILWYYKINERLELQKETNRLLRKMVGEPPIDDNPMNLIETKIKVKIIP